MNRLHPKIIDLTLGRIERLLARLGHPERGLPPVVHVAGTNGKGSVIAYLSAMLRADGRTVHAYTSPHLVRFHERIALGGRPVDEARLGALLEECEAANEGEAITFFEITTAAAMLAFSREPADVLLAAEKAGILKPGVGAVVGPQPPVALEVIRARAESLAASLSVCGEDWSFDVETETLSYRDGEGTLSLPKPRLLGAHLSSKTPPSRSPQRAGSATWHRARQPSATAWRRSAGPAACSA
jgi:dihydrofolate synthase/folylpolyglutamate synthase